MPKRTFVDPRTKKHFTVEVERKDDTVAKARAELKRERRRARNAAIFSDTDGMCCHAVKGKPARRALDKKFKPRKRVRGKWVEIEDAE